jgi:hypothetical protein
VSISVDRVDLLFSAVLDRCDVIHQICCGTVDVSFIVRIDLKPPIRLMHRFEPSS